jgi:hypothetical protein
VFAAGKNKQEKCGNNVRGKKTGMVDSNLGINFSLLPKIVIASVFDKWKKMKF